MNKKLGNALKYILSFSLAALLIWLACSGIDWAEFLAGLKATRWGWIALFFVAAVLAIVFRCLRWVQLLRPVDEHVTFRRVFDATNIGAMASIVVPGSSEIVRCGIISRKGASFQTVLGTILVERAWDFVAIGVMCILTLFVGWGRFGGFFVDNIWHPVTSHKIIVWGFVALVVLAVLLVAAIRLLRGRNSFFAKLNYYLEGFVDGIKSFARVENKLYFLLNTLGIWAMYMLMSWLTLKAIPELSSLTLADALFITTVGNLATLVPVPGGIGAYHYVLKVSLSALYGITEETGLLFAMLCHELHAVAVLLLGVASYISRSFDKLKIYS